MRTAGVVGGFGPQTTARFYERVFFACQHAAPDVKPHILISSVPLPFQIENNAILNNEGVDDYLPYLITETRRLEAAGADFIVMPCNSLHIHIDALRSGIGIPFLSIIQESADFLVSHSIQRVAVLSTAMTAYHRLYEKGLSTCGIYCITPDQDQQHLLNEIVLHLVNGRNEYHDRETLREVMRSFTDADCILLACTDLQLLDLDHPTLPVFDTMQILVTATVRELLK
ncbi:MAG: amino acid racemase [Chloroflexi bacterium]|nr:amino acid racemase [Chloroflexota bacterium]